MSFSLASATSSTARMCRRPRFARGLATPASLPRTTTPTEAQAYLTQLLSLPPGAEFSPALALQILTHKSFRFVHRAAHPPPYTAEETAQGLASHNGRLIFVGRRALDAYTALFLHSALGSSERVRETDFLRGVDLETRLKNIRDNRNIGRTVGEKWGVGKVMRCDWQPNGEDTGYAEIKGQTVAAILGGVFTQHGSPAAQRVFHAHVLPALSGQLRDPALKEAAETLRRDAATVGTVAK